MGRHAQTRLLAAATGVLAFVMTIGTSPRATAEGTTTTLSEWPVPDIDMLPDDTWGRTVRQGHDLVAHTAALIGPEVSDPAHRLAGNNLDCQSCHVDAGTRRYALPFVGVFADYPQYRARSGSVSTIEERINGCMTRSMNGKPLKVDGPEMIAIVAYMKFLSTGRTVGVPTSGRGSVPLKELARPADPVRGGNVFDQYCTACHGADGQGQRTTSEEDHLGYAIPPLWGADSFNDGAGMNRLATAAGFIRSAMPHGTTWDAPVLSVDDAWDVAAFVVSHQRPHRRGLEQDYPDLLEKPIDAPYGPYIDTFDVKQHRFGPFAPIRTSIKGLAAARDGARQTQGNRTP